MANDAPEPERVDPLQGLQERLHKNSAAFESLLALTPAREYYGSHFVDGQDPSEQWNRKKQTKEQKRAAKKAKLDPKNNQSALDVLREREAAALKRKRDEDDEEEQAQEGGSPLKRQRSEEDAEAVEARRRQKAERKKEKQQLKKEKKAAKQAKAETKKARKQEEKDNASERRPAPVQDDEDDNEEDEDAEETSGAQMAGLQNSLDFSGLESAGSDNMDSDDAASHISSAPTTPVVHSPSFDLGTSVSTTSSSTSIIPPSVIDNTASHPGTYLKLDTDFSSAANTTPSVVNGISSPKPRIPDMSSVEKQERLRARIEELRAARKADDKPARSRQELLDQRRKKDEQRKAHKKELRRKQKEDEARRREEQLRGSGSPLSGDIFSPRSSIAPQPQENAYAFSRLAFEDGTSADASLSTLKDPSKKRGPQDPKTALQAAQAKQSRLAGYDSAKRGEIEDKDRWMNARKRAGGERVRDDSSLLKKALKRKEKDKNRSEKFWQEKEQSVVHGKEMKQKKREANLAKRKEEKGGKGKKGAKGGKKGGTKKPKKRAGFEGRFKA